MRMLTTAQVLAVLRRLEGRRALTYKQLRDLEDRGCSRPQVLPGGRGPRLYDLGDVMMLRLVARMQADPMLARWQAWAVVAHLHDELRQVLLTGASRVLMVQGAVGRIVTAREVEQMSGVPFELAPISRGVVVAMRSRSGDDVWTGWMWAPARKAAALARPLETLQEATA
jgi:hypothetical protein